MDAQRYVPIEAGGWRGFARRDAAGFVDGADPRAILLAMPNRLIKNRGQTATHLISSPMGDLILRQSVGKRRRWLGGPASLRTMRVHESMAASGLSVAAPVLAMWRGGGDAREELLVTRAIVGQSLARLLHGSDETRRRSLLAAGARAIALLHLRGFVHGDMLPGNILVEEPSGAMVFIDNERTGAPIGPLFRYARRRNLAQMAFRLRYMVPMRTMRCFFDAYYEAYPIPERVRRRERLWAIRKARRRLESRPMKR